MPSPFPGMDPFLEEPKLWPTLQHYLIITLQQLLQPSLADRYRARIGCRQYRSEFPLFTSVIRTDHSEEFLEIYARSDGRLVTLMEVVSIANRTTTEGRSAYLATRQEALDKRANVVEIDLVTQGKPLLSYSRDGLPEHDQTVTVTRGHAPDRYEIYTATLMKRLPKFKLPLASEDRDTILDLQLALTRAMELGNLANAIDYKQPLPADVGYKASTREWIDDFLKQQHLR